MKKEFVKSNDILKQIKKLEKNFNIEEIKMPLWKELAWIGSGKRVFFAQAITFMACLFLSYVILMFTFYSFEVYILTATILYGIIMISYSVNTQNSYNISELRKQADIVDQKEALYEKYNQSLEMIDIKQLKYNNFTHEESAILMDRKKFLEKEESQRSNVSIYISILAIFISLATMTSNT